MHMVDKPRDVAREWLMPATVDSDGPNSSSNDLGYVFKPSLLGSAWEFRLRPDVLEWQAGRMWGRVPYETITRVRLSYRPTTLQQKRFITEVWSSTAPKLTIASTSWKSVIEQERNDDAYSAFVRELNRRIGAAGAQTEFVSGSPPLLYWPGVAVLIAASVVLLAILVRTVMSLDWAGAAFIVAFIALLIWQIVPFFRRNRPGTYRPDSVPADLMP
jgi:hypothetical protein